MGSLSVVYDTNVLVSGIGFGGKPWKCLLLVFLSDVELVASEETLDEFSRVLGYDHLPFTDQERESFPALLAEEATLVRPEIDITAVDDDPDDNKFIECAVEGSATYVVSGDPHLKDIEEYDGIEILDPASFLDRIA